MTLRTGQLAWYLAAPYLAMPAVALADDAIQFTPEVQLRTRAEGDSGRDGASGGEVFFVSQRSRLGGTLAWGDVASGRVVLSDVRVFGEEAHTRRDFHGEGVDVRVAVLSWRLNETLELRLGRDEVSFMDERLLAIANWRQPGRSFDGIQLLGQGDGWSGQSHAFMLDEGDVTDFESTDQAVPGGRDSWIWLNHGGWSPDGGMLHAVAILDRVGAADQTRATLGAFAKGGAGPFSGRVEAYAQRGSAGDDAVAAWMVGLSGTYTADLPAEPSVTLWYDYLSGDEDLSDGVHRTFDTLYGANHRYYGNMDIATFVKGGKVGSVGLQDAAIMLGAAPTEKLKLALDAHLFATANGAPEPLLGSELDATLTYAVAKALTLKAGAGLWQPLDGAAQPDGWGWVMVDFRL